MLTERISGCDAVLHMVGICYGEEAADQATNEPRLSYTQMEYQIARALRKPTFVFLFREDFGYDPQPPENEGERALQAAHRESIQRSSALYTLITTHEELRLRVREMEVKPRPAESAGSRAGPGLGTIIATLGFVVVAGLVGYELNRRSAVTTQVVPVEEKRPVAPDTKQDAMEAELQRMKRVAEETAKRAEEVQKQNEANAQRIRELEKAHAATPTPYIPPVVYAPPPTPAYVAPAPVPAPLPRLPNGFEDFITGFWNHHASNNAWDWANDFSEQTDYEYAKGGASRSFIANDWQKLINRYPTRNYSNLSLSNIQVESDSSVQLNMSFNYRFSGAKNASGSTTTHLTCKRVGGSWKITKFRETINR